MSLPAPVAAVRAAVREELVDVGPGETVVVACSGGADSLALVAATVFVGGDRGWHVVGVTVDHGLQPGSDERAAAVVGQMAELGVAETVAVTVDVRASGQGPEAAAREARYAVLAEVADRFGASVVLLGHTLDDQAETVLLGLARGSGGRSIAGMRRRFEVFRRPLLQVGRAQTRAACSAEGIGWWDDPHNSDPRFARARVRQRVLPVLEQELGPGVAAALARTAALLQADLAALDQEAERVLAEVRGPGPGLLVDPLRTRPEAVRTRVLRAAALEAGSPPSELFWVHVRAMDDLLSGPSGRRVDLPGHVRCRRDGGVLVFQPGRGRPGRAPLR